MASPFQASLLLRSFKENRHAARNEAEDLEDPAGPKNTLPSLVRDLDITSKAEVSLGRGGGSVYLELITLCKNIEELTFCPTMLKSAG